MDDNYIDFAKRYDWMREQNPSRDDFFRQLIQKYNVTDILDCACGTGHDLILFHSLGCNVTGSDYSAAMLSQAGINLAAFGLEIPIQENDFRNLPDYHSGNFDAVVCLSNSINEMLDEAEVVRALRSMSTVLRPGGILILDQGQTDASMQDPPRIVPIINNRDYSRLFAIEYAKYVMKVTIADFIHTEEDSSFHNTTVNIAIRLKDTWDKLFSEAGFSDIDYFGDWACSAYNKQDSQRLIAVARKSVTRSPDE